MKAQSEAAAQEPLIHWFESAGLGLAPFRFVGTEHKLFTIPGTDVCKPGSSCDYCGTAISQLCWVESSDGKRFKVGSDCIAKAGGVRLAKALKAHQSTERKAKSEVARANDRAARALTKAEACAAFIAKHDGLAEALKVEHPIIADIAAQVQRFGKLSDKQIAFVMKLAKEATEPKVEEKNIPAPVSSNRVTFSGKVVSAKIQHSDVYGSQWRMTVKVTTAEGAWLAWGTIPAGMIAQVPYDQGGTLERLRGADVIMTARLVAGKDAHFAIMKRPAGKVLAFADGSQPVAAAAP